MRAVAFSTQFAKDVKRLVQRGKNMEKLKWVLEAIGKDERLDPIHRDHKLIGNTDGRRECHIESDWLMIYKEDKTRVIFERTGTHADLFR